MKARAWRVAERDVRSAAGHDERPDLDGGRWRRAWRRSRFISGVRCCGRWAKDDPQSNNGMHPTRDTAALINYKLVGGRGMPGVRSLLRIALCKLKARASRMAK